jgi:hypothetical protein
MPRIATNYETTPVSFYRFVCNDPEIQSSYVGQTVNFRERKHQHKIACNTTNYHTKIYQTIRDNGGFDNWRMIEIESRLVKDKREAERIETELMEKFQSDMNIRKSVRTETVDEYNHNYYQKNADKIKEQSKQYRLENADKCSEYHKQYHLKNPNKIKERNSKKVVCDCGCVVIQNHISRHKKTLKHIELMELKNS